MRSVLVWLLRGLAAGLTVAAVGLLLGWYLVSRSLPDYSADLVMAGVGNPIEVVRDQYGVPHIRAASDDDAFYALGVVHAQDRLWQMELSRRAASGRLSALFGERALGLDRMVRTFDLYGRAEASLAHQSPEAQAALERYAAGVNAWLGHVNAEAKGRGAPEFFIFPTEIAPWTPADSLAVLKMMALRLTASARHEVRRARFLLALPPERVADILPDNPNKASGSPPRAARADLGLPEPRTLPAEGPDPLPEPLQDPLPDIVTALFGPLADPALAPELGGASNAWAVDGSRTATGAPLLANDPHMWLSAPSLWYLADLGGGGTEAIGATLPGVPLVVIGHNGQLGWGLTTAQVDDQDLYIEKLDPKNRTRYQTPDGWETFVSRTVRIEVAGDEPVEHAVLESRHGPVLSHDMLGVDTVTPAGHVAALAWTALAREDRTFTSLFRLMHARDIDGAIDAGVMALAPAQVVTVADRSGVAMFTAGAVPQRSSDSRSQGRVPSPGWIAENDWDGIFPAADNPRVVRPATGAVATANNKLSDAAFPRHLTFDWGDPYRIQRLTQELAAREFHSRDGFVALQNDAVSQMARSVLPQIAVDLWWRGEDQDGVGTLRREALEALADWTGNMDQHAPEPLIFAEWMRTLTLRIAQDELGPLIREVPGPQPVFVERVFGDVDGAAVWCDITKTQETESCSHIAATALDESLARLEGRYGSNIEGWRWGAAHFAEHEHMPLSGIGPLGTIFSIRQETSGWDFTLLRGMSLGSGDTPFRNVHAAGFRVVMDFADLDRSVWILATGQSGHPFSRFYDNLSDSWARGDVIPMSRDPEDSRAGSAGVMTLHPADATE